jgi:nucleotide-binding universal stress UspA family protein
MSGSRALHRLLLATERTELDRGAERVAIALAHSLGTSLSIVLPFATNEELLCTEPTLALETEKKVAADLRALVNDARAHGVVATPTVRRGALLWQEIVAAAAEGAELLLTRRVGRRGLLARLLVGEMVSQVAAHAPCPVLMVPVEATGLWTRRVIVLAVAGRRVEAVAAALAAVSGARVDQRAGGLAEAASAAGAEDLLVHGLSTEQVATGRLAQEIVASIGVAPCPVVLVGPAQRVEA